MISYALALHLAVKLPLSRSEAEDEVSSMSLGLKQAGYSVLAFDGTKILGQLEQVGEAYAITSEA